MPNEFSHTQRVLWLGAHKTGTTYLQGMLDATSVHLQQGGVEYESLGSFRDRYTRPLLNKGFLSRPAPARDFRRGSTQTILFDENIPGLVQNAISRQIGLYPMMEIRVRKVVNYLDFEPQILLFGIRNLVGYLPSLYCEMLKSTPYQTFEHFMKRVPDQLQWYWLAKRMAAMFPDAPLYIYRAEDLRGNERRLLSSLTGVPATDFNTNIEQERSGFSKKAIRRLKKLSETQEVTRSDVFRMNRRFPKSTENPGFDPFGDARRQRFNKLYEKDLVEIDADPNMTLIDFAKLS